MAMAAVTVVGSAAPIFADSTTPGYTVVKMIGKSSKTITRWVEK